MVTMLSQEMPVSSVARIVQIHEDLINVLREYITVYIKDDYWLPSYEIIGTL